MKLEHAQLPGCWIVYPEPIADERGHFARTWCRETFEKNGLTTRLSQCSVAFNRKAGTLRGMHYQAEPHSETKLIRCTRGRIFDVLLDLRPDSETYRKWQSFELQEGAGMQLYVPPGIAHGYISLRDDSELFYMIDKPYAPDAARGVRWDDPAFGIEWPMKPAVISAKDQMYPDLTA